MTKIRVTKQFNFEMAHALENYDGLCRNIHGHSYILHITIIGEPIKDPQNTKCGMVMDFSDLKKIVSKNIIEKLDHTLLLLDNEDNRNKCQMMKEKWSKIELTKFQPTCENLLIDIVQQLKPLLINSVALISVRLYETATSYAEWFESDNI